MTYDDIPAKSLPFIDAIDARGDARGDASAIVWHLGCLIMPVMALPWHRVSVALISGLFSIRISMLSSRWTVATLTAEGERVGIQALGVSVCRQFEEEEWHTTISIAANRPYLVHLRALHDFYRFWIRGWKQANRKMRSGSKHTSTKGVLASIRRPLGCSTWLRDPLLSLESDRNQTYSKFLYQPLPCLLSTKDWCLTIQVISLNFSFLYVLFCQRFWSVEFSCLTTFNDGLLGQSMTALISAKISW